MALPMRWAQGAAENSGNTHNAHKPPPAPVNVPMLDPSKPSCDYKHELRQGHAPQSCRGSKGEGQSGRD